MQFKEGTQLYSSEVQREGGEDVLYINYLGAPYVPNLSSSPEVMERTMNSLMENPSISRIVLVQQKNYNYDLKETSYLLEISHLYIYFIKQEKILSHSKLVTNNEQAFSQRYNDIFSFLYILKQDPIAAYNELKKILIEAKIALHKIDPAYKIDQSNYIHLLEKNLELIQNSKLIQAASPHLTNYQKGQREIYRHIFNPDIIPNFTFTRLVTDLPENSEIISQYKIAHESYDESLVTILKRKDEAKLMYHLSPPENSLSEDHNMLLNLARGVLIEHQPKAEEFTDTERTRQVFFNISKDLLQDLAQSKEIVLSYSDLNKLATILVRHTIGFGLIEVLLQDKKLQDIVLNAPIPLVNIFARHGEYGECTTNILPSHEDVNSWAAKFRMISGRPLDEANPILDTQLGVGNIRARIAIVQKPLSPDGLAYAIRRHRENPWTLPLFIKNKMINPLAAGLLSFLIDGSRTLLVAGTRSSGKTSLLGSLMLEIMAQNRIIVIEDSVTGDSKIVIKKNKKFEKTTIGELIDNEIEKNRFLDKDKREKSLNPDNIEIFSTNKQGKIILAKPSKFIRHKANKQIYEIKTTSGKKIKVTEDHSLFTLDEKNIFKEIKSKNIKEGSFIAIPSKLPFNLKENKTTQINLLNHLNLLDKKIFILGKGIEDYIKKSRKELFALGYSLGYHKSTIQNWTRKKILPAKVFAKIKHEIKKEKLLIKSEGNSTKIPAKINLNQDFLSFVGLWLADGCYDKNSTIISVQEEENRKIVRRIAKKFNAEVKMHSDKFSLMINSTLLKEVMQKVLGLKGNSYTKHIPSWAYNLSDKKVGALLKGFFSGDGCASDKEIVFALCSKTLIDDIATLLLRFGIILRTSGMKEKDKTFSCRIGNTKQINSFKKKIGFLVKKKQKRLNKLCKRISTHDTSDIIPISLTTKKELHKILGRKFNKNDYINRQNNIGRNHLKRLISFIPEKKISLSSKLKKIVEAEIFWDKVKTVKKVNKEKFVYDISVPECENFICENIIAHNTLELPAESMRKLNYNILRMKVRSALLKTTNEVSAEDGIRTSLRLGDSCLIIGEVRSAEAKALYEAMRVGALANVVAGTIHGASPYGVYDRVVNDLEVPNTSFKATDIIAVANPIKSPDGMHSWRRLLELAEVRKHWKNDPMEEKGFVDLLKYNVEKDELEPTEDLINGDSEIIKDIAANVKGWAGNWDAVYDNILLRSKIKNEIVEVAKKTGNENILESSFNVLSNNAFHQISDNVRQEIGLPLSNRVFPEWQRWLNEQIKGKRV